MKFSCNQIELNGAIQSVSKIIGKSTVPALNGILFDVTKNKLRLVGSDMKITIEAEIDAKIESKGAAVIPAIFITELIKKLPSSIIEFTMDDKGNVLIECDQLKFKVLSYNANEYPEITLENEEENLEIDKNLLDSIIKQVKFAIAKDETRPVLTGALFEFENNKLNVVAIDGFRMAMRKVEIDSNINKKIIIPEKSLLELQKLITSVDTIDSEEKVKISISQNQLCFKYGNVKLISNRIAGEFTNYNQIIPKDIRSIVQIDKELITQTIDRSILVIRTNKNQAIKFNIKDDFLEITSNSEIGDSKENLPIRLEGDDLEIGFNPKFIMDFLRVADGENLVFKFTNEIGPCLISSLDNDEYMYMLLPCRL